MLSRNPVRKAGFRRCGIGFRPPQEQRRQMRLESFTHDRRSRAPSARGREVEKGHGLVSERSPQSERHALAVERLEALATGDVRCDAGCHNSL